MKPGGVTPTIVRTALLIEIVFPTAASGEPKRDIASACVSTTPDSPSPVQSPAPKTRPRHGRTPRMSKKLGVTYETSRLCASAPRPEVADEVHQAASSEVDASRRRMVSKTG